MGDGGTSSALLAWYRARGDDWLERGEALSLAVPSVVVPRERNLILNPRHADFGRVSVIGVARYRFDPRMGG